jgi:hypothetical protein
MSSALSIFYVYGSIVGGLVLMWPLTAMLNANNWGLFHGDIVFAWPVLSGLTYLVLRFLLVPATRALFCNSRADRGPRERDD